MVTKKEAFRQVKIGTCPICGQRIHLAMTVATGEPAQPSSVFWGQPGRRRRICERGAWFHFVVNDEEGDEVHRLAYLEQRAMMPSEPARPRPEDGPVQLALGGKILIQQR